MKTGKNRMFKRNISRFLSFIMIISVLSAYGCNKGKTIDPNFYPTAVESGSETQETSKETKTEKPRYPMKRFSNRKRILSGKPASLNTIPRLFRTGYLRKQKTNLS